MFSKVLYLLLFAWQALIAVGSFAAGDPGVGFVALTGAVTLMVLIIVGGRDNVKSLFNVTLDEAKPLIRHNAIFLVLTLCLLVQSVLIGTDWYWYLIYPLLWTMNGWEIWKSWSVLKRSKREEELRARLDRGESLVDKPRPWVSAPPCPKPPVVKSK